MLSLVLAAAFFVGIHIFISGTWLRGVIVDRTGERAFQALFSLLSVGGIVWLCWAYTTAGDVLLWGQINWFKPVALVVMVFAFLFVAIGLTTPTPTAVGGESQLNQNEPAMGILRITRHPFLWGVAIWAFAHLVLNGDAASLVLFGALLFLALIGPRMIDAKRGQTSGKKWTRFIAVTSNVPFGAIIEGRNSLKIRELGWWRVGTGLVLYGLFLHFHLRLFGVSPYPS